MNLIGKNITCIMMFAFNASIMIAAKTIDTVNCSVQQYGSIKLCGDASSRQCVIMLYMGKVYASDSLFGFNCQLSYDTSKVRFTSALFTNTLAGQFDFHELTTPITSKHGEIWCSAGNLDNRMVYGDLPLVAVVGNYTGECTDPVYIHIDTISFTDEFYRNKAVRQVDGYIQPIYGSNNYDINTKFPIDSVKFVKDSILKFTSNVSIYKESKIDTLWMELTNSNINQFKLNKINSLTNNITIDTISNTDNKVEFKITNNDFNNTNITIEYEYIRNHDSDEIAKLELIPMNVNNCSCFNKFNKSSVILKSFKNIDTTNGIVNTYNNKEITYKLNYDYLNNDLNIHVDIIDNYTMKLYNIYGNLIKLFNFNNDTKYNLVDLIDGVYYSSLIKSNNEIGKYIFIK